LTGRAVIAVRAQELRDSVAGELEIFRRLLHADARLAGGGEQKHTSRGDVPVRAKHGEQSGFPGARRSDQHRKARFSKLLEGGSLLGARTFFQLVDLVRVLLSQVGIKEFAPTGFDGKPLTLEPLKD